MEGNVVARKIDREYRMDFFFGSVAETPRSGRAGTLEPRPAKSKADFGDRLDRVMGKISKTRAYLAK